MNVNINNQLILIYSFFFFTVCIARAYVYHPNLRTLAYSLYIQIQGICIPPKPTQACIITVYIARSYVYHPNQRTLAYARSRYIQLGHMYTTQTNTRLHIHGIYSQGICIPPKPTHACILLDCLEGNKLPTFFQQSLTKHLFLSTSRLDSKSHISKIIYLQTRS